MTPFFMYSFDTVPIDKHTKIPPLNILIQCSHLFIDKCFNMFYNVRDD